MEFKVIRYEIRPHPAVLLQNLVLALAPATPFAESIVCASDIRRDTRSDQELRPEARVA